MSTTPNRLSKADFEKLSEFRYQIRRFERFSEKAAQAEGITPLQYLLLLHIKGFPGRAHASIGELAERLQAQHHGVVALVTRCEAAGLVERRTSAADARRVEVQLLPAGERVLTHLADLHRRELHSLRGQFTIPSLLTEEE
ncbi:MAG: MarR family winged helix-turn-helix transcriptional regulator [Telluria sp.]